MVMGREETSWTEFLDWKATGTPAEEDSLEQTDTGPGDWASSLALVVSTSLGFWGPHCPSSVSEASSARRVQHPTGKIPLHPARWEGLQTAV